MAADFSEMDRRQSLERFVGLWGQRQKSPAPVLFVKRGTRPGLFAPKENVTQFRWSMAGGTSGLLGGSRTPSAASVAPVAPTADPTGGEGSSPEES